MKLITVIHSVRMFSVSVPSFNVNADGDRRCSRSSPKQFFNDFHIRSKLRLSMRVKELDSLFPRPSNPRPFRFSMYRFLSSEVILFDNGVSTAKLLWLVIMVITSIHPGMKLLKVDIFVCNDVFPNRTRKGVWHRLSLHKIDDGICSLFCGIGLPEFPCLLKVSLSLSRPEIFLQVWGFSKNFQGNS
jgi:hypothetical protein